MTSRDTDEPRPVALETARDRHQGQAADRLWAAIPAGMRLSRFHASTVPGHYRDAFVNSSAWRAGIDLSGLPARMRLELAWCVFRIIELGGKVPTPTLGMLARRLGEVTADLGAGAPSSLTGLPAETWLREISLAVHRRTGRLPGTWPVKHLRGMLQRFLQLLAAATDDRPWWQRELWKPAEDGRIPVRKHEPRRNDALNFGRISMPWLRSGMQWHCKAALETGTLTWTSLHHRLQAAVVFDAFLAARQTCGPQLAGDPAQVRVLMLEFLGHLKAMPAACGRSVGQPVSAAHVKQTAVAIEQFYRFMHDNKDAAAAALAEPGWLRLGPQHSVFFRRGELPRPRLADPDADVISDTAMSEIMAAIGVLGDPAGQGGFGDEQGMRVMMLQARLGRRINEICLLDRDPLLPVNTPDPAAPGDPGAFAAKLRYQQTKIDGAPDTILVDAEVVAIIRAQQEWADRWLAGHAAAGVRPGYLFLASEMNRHAGKPYSHHTLRRRLNVLARRLDIRDPAGRLVDFNRTHRFRHTKATSLINAGVPLHVVQRYLGHLTPTMTMLYAKTLAETAEAEFLRFRKLTADARELEADPKDLYDMLQLDQRTDRVLPNGWCLLPPRQSCDRGNACLTCDKFATDATFLPELQQQKDRTLRLIGQRQQAFSARTGTPMGEDNIWLQGRRREAASLESIITTLQRHPDTEDKPGQHPGPAPTTRPAGGPRRRRGRPHQPDRRPRPPAWPARRAGVTAGRPGNLANLQKAAAARTAATTARAEAALDHMLRTGQPITFRGLAAAAPVSLDFLYRTPAIRQRIEQLRGQQQTRPAQHRDTGPDQPGNVIAALTGQLTQLRRRHREEVAELRRALEAAHGENLLLRRRLGHQHTGPSPATTSSPAGPSADR